MNSKMKQTGLIALGAILLLVVVWWFFLIAPQSRQLKKAHTARATAEKQISTLQGQIDQLQGLVREEPADRQALATLKAAIPDNPQLDVALNSLQDAADQSGIIMTSIGPSAPAATVATTASPPATTSSSSKSSTSVATTVPSSSSASSVPMISLAISASGSYQEVMTFITLLDNRPRTFVVSSLNLSGTGGKLSAQINANVYYAGQPTP